jgi:hypothetical protein
MMITSRRQDERCGGLNSEAHIPGREESRWEFDRYYGGRFWLRIAGPLWRSVQRSQRLEGAYMEK